MPQPAFLLDYGPLQPENSYRFVARNAVYTGTCVTAREVHIARNLGLNEPHNHGSLYQHSSKKKNKYLTNVLEETILKS